MLLAEIKAELKKLKVKGITGKKKCELLNMLTEAQKKIEATPKRTLRLKKPVPEPVVEPPKPTRKLKLKKPSPQVQENSKPPVEMEAPKIVKKLKLKKPVAKPEEVRKLDYKKLNSADDEGIYYYSDDAEREYREFLNLIRKSKLHWPYINSDEPYEDYYKRINIPFGLTNALEFVKTTDKQRDELESALTQKFPGVKADIKFHKQKRYFGIHMKSATSKSAQDVYDALKELDKKPFPLKITGYGEKEDKEPEEEKPKEKPPTKAQLKEKERQAKEEAKKLKEEKEKEELRTKPLEKLKKEELKEVLFAVYFDRDRIGTTKQSKMVGDFIAKNKNQDIDKKEAIIFIKENIPDYVKYI